MGAGENIGADCENLLVDAKNLLSGASERREMKSRPA